jgi:hypothetical protein
MIAGHACHLRLYFCFVIQGLIVQATPVTTPYSFVACRDFLVSSGDSSAVCSAWGIVSTESAQVIPPFLYRNQCSSVLLGAYIPVLIIGFSIQLLLTLFLPFIVLQIGKLCNLTKIIIRYKLVTGILWPDFWLQQRDSTTTVVAGNKEKDKEEDLNRRNKMALESDPTILLSPETIFCFDILNNLVILFTFGLCSPVLALAVGCVTVLRMNMWVLLLGKFVCKLHPGDEMTQSADRKGMVHFGLVALMKVNFCLKEVLQNSYWHIAGVSTLFVSLLCWDMAGDELSWLESIWLPVTMALVLVVLRVVAWALRRRNMVYWNSNLERNATGGWRSSQQGQGGNHAVELRASLPSSLSVLSGSGVKKSDSDHSTNPMHSSLD